MINRGLDTNKIISYSKVAMFPSFILGLFLVYFFSVTEHSESMYQTIHNIFLGCAVCGIAILAYLRVLSSVVSIFVIYVSYFVINSMRYAYGEDYIFSSGYNLWIMLALPNLLLINNLFKSKIANRYWSCFFVFIFLEKFIIERLLSQNIDADSIYFYKHIGMMNYPSVCLSLFCIFSLLINYISKGKILIVKTLFSSVSLMLAFYFSSNLQAYSLFFLSSVLIELIVSIYYVFYIKYKNEELNLANYNLFFHEAEKKYPPKYSIALLYIDEYERIKKRFGAQKTLLLKKMFLKRIAKLYPNVKIYNYQEDALILVFMNINMNECFTKAEDIRRLIATSIFIFNENNHLQLTVSQCVSEKKRSDANAEVVLQRAEASLQKACKFTRNITVKS